MFEILVVDDDEAIGWALEKGLEDEGMRITRVCRGEEAIREVRRREFDAAIIDVKLPSKSGIEVARIIRQLLPRLPIVMISGYYYEEDQPIQEGIQTGDFQGFISKPFLLEAVSVLLRQVIKESGKSQLPRSARLSRDTSRAPGRGTPQR
jgi:CheY-like chemotaxis protein